MSFQWRNSKGFGTVSFSLVVAAVTLGYYYYQHGTFLNEQKIVAKSVADIRIKVIEEKLSKMSGFLIASNLIACKQSAWENGDAGKTCKWNEANYEGDTTHYVPVSFHLALQGLDNKNRLTFNVDTKNLFSGDGNEQFLTGSNTWLKFSLVSQNSLTSNFGKIVKNVKNNQDNYLVLLEGNIEYYNSDKKIVAESFVTAMRRPLAIPKVKIKTSSCAQRCDVSAVESPNPSCRSSFYIDKDTITSIEGETKNLGPGLIYDLKYDRVTAYNQGATVSIVPNTETNVDIGIVDFLIPGRIEKWADTFPCGTLSETITKSVQVVQQENNKLIDSFISFKWNKNTIIEQMGQVLLSEASAAFVAVDAGSTSTSSLSQHSNPAGVVVYNINSAENSQSSIEPYRLTSNEGLTSGSQKFSGLMDTTVNTNFYKMIWVNPPH